MYAIRSYYGETSTVSDFLLPLLLQARTLSIQSDGLFNPAIGRLIALWGFHSDERNNFV